MTKSKKGLARASIGFPVEFYQSLENIAGKKVSLAWVVRDAAEIYVSKQEQLEGEDDAN
jgi:hypothetical protein